MHGDNGEERGEWGRVGKEGEIVGDSGEERVESGDSGEERGKWGCVVTDITHPVHLSLLEDDSKSSMRLS